MISYSSLKKKKKKKAHYAPGTDYIYMKNIGNSKQT